MRLEPAKAGSPGSTRMPMISVFVMLEGLRHIAETVSKAIELQPDVIPSDINLP